MPSSGSPIKAQPAHRSSHAPFDVFLKHRRVQSSGGILKAQYAKVCVCMCDCVCVSTACRLWRILSAWNVFVLNWGLLRFLKYILIFGGSSSLALKINIEGEGSCKVWRFCQAATDHKILNKECLKQGNRSYNIVHLLKDIKLFLI